jgi:hypothetical protein
MEAAMEFTMPHYADADDVVDRALSATAKGVPVSLGNLLPSLRWRLSGLEISEPLLAERVRERAARLDVALID